jgi:hypothetical protein
MSLTASLLWIGIPMSLCTQLLPQGHNCRRDTTAASDCDSHSYWMADDTRRAVSRGAACVGRAHLVRRRHRGRGDRGGGRLRGGRVLRGLGVGVHPIVTLEKQILDLIGNLV